MTRAQQTLSVLLLVSSVSLHGHKSPYPALADLSASLSPQQLYMVLYVGLVPLNETVQKEVIPVVRLPIYPFSFCL